MEKPRELAQMNIRVPSETMGYLRVLAREAGMKLHPYIIQVLEESADQHLAAIGREAFMDNLNAEHQARVSFYEERFDSIEATKTPAWDPER